MLSLRFKTMALIDFYCTYSCLRYVIHVKNCESFYLAVKI